MPTSPPSPLHHVPSPAALQAAKRAVLMIHGAGSSHLFWGRVGRTSAASSWPLVRLDLPGHGKSPGPPMAVIDGYAAKVEELVGSLGLSEVVLVGHSMGGAIAMTVALGAPPWLRGLVLVSTGGRLRVHPGFLAGLVAGDPASIELLRMVGFGPGASPSLVEETMASYRACPLEVLRDDFLGCDRFDVLERLDTISVPTEVVVGSADQLTPAKFAARLAKAIPGAHLTLVEGIGHLLPLEAPQAVTDALDRLFDAMGDAAAAPTGAPRPRGPH